MLKILNICFKVGMVKVLHKLDCGININIQSIKLFNYNVQQAHGKFMFHWLRLVTSIKVLKTKLNKIIYQA